MSINNLSEILRCKECAMFYKDPVILPCGKKICKEHVQNKDEYDCLKFCQEKHSIPNEGFPICSDIVNIMELNLHVDEATKNSYKSINEFDDLRKQREIINKDPNNYIHDYISNLKNKIDLRRDSLISKINQISEDMLNQVNELDVECREKLNESNISKIIYETEFEKLEKQSNYWKYQLRNPNISDNKKDEILNELKESLNREKEALLELKNRIMDRKGCFFEPGETELEKEDFGELIFEDCEKE